MYSFGQLPFSAQSMSGYSSKFVPPYMNSVTAGSTAVSAGTDALLGQLCKEFSYQSLFNATGGFSKPHVLGTGSFGAVYRGVLEDQTEVAVKVMSNPSQAGFEDEVKVLSKFRHPNLIMLLGFARNGQERLLVYECMDNGDCEKLLKTPKLCATFSWTQRLSILLDTCKGIAYLVNSNPMAFHRDIKPSNMLVDRNWVGKMADFGLSCELPSADSTSVRLQNSAGTIGYACQHYIRTGVVSEATEVYSFGICILEFLTNQPPAVSNPMLPGQIVYLVETLQGRIANLLHILDKKAGWPERVATALGELVFSCANQQLANRPRFVTVVKRINEIFKQCQATNLEPSEQAKPISRTSTGALSPVKAFKVPQIIPPIPLSPQPMSARVLPNNFQAFHSLMNTSRGEDMSMASATGRNSPAGKSPVWMEVRAYSAVHDAPRSFKVEFSPAGECVVGRNRQSGLFNSILYSDQLRLCVSREHFTIRKLGDSGRFELENLSGNGTLVDGREFLESKGQRCEVVNGDVIKLVQTSATGIQTPFIILKFFADQAPVHEAPASYRMTARNVAVNPTVAEDLEFTLDRSSKMIQMIGRNTGDGIFTRILGNEQRWLGMIEPSHFAVIMDEARSLVIRPLTDKGVIVGTKYYPKGMDARVSMDSASDIQFPGVAQIVLNVTEVQLGEENGRGPPPAFSTARREKR